jgi:hypothetical protein
MNQEDSIIFEITNFDVKSQKAFEEIVKITWNQDKQSSLGKFEDIFIKIRSKFKYLLCFISNWLEERNIKENPNNTNDIVRM